MKQFIFLVLLILSTVYLSANEYKQLEPNFIISKGLFYAKKISENFYIKKHIRRLCSKQVNNDSSLVLNQMTEQELRLIFNSCINALKE